MLRNKILKFSRRLEIIPEEAARVGMLHSKEVRVIIPQDSQEMEVLTA